MSLYKKDYQQLKIEKTTLIKTYEKIDYIFYNDMHFIM